MKVCIIGAGTSGLSCALTLEKYGIVPDIFEQYNQIDERSPFINCLLKLWDRPVKDSLIDLRNRYNIDIKPLNPLNSIVMFSQNKMVKVTGSLGYIFEKGPARTSVDYQLSEKLSAKIQFDVVADYKNLSARYDRVVVATGSPYIAKELGIWTDNFRSWVRGAIVEGNFDTTAWITWFNKDYANSGYAYMGPFNSKTASLVLIISGVKEKDVEDKWKLFLQKEQLNYHETQSFRLEHIAGYCCPKEKGNIMFIGNAGGMLEPSLGFGIYNGIVSGVCAAQAIINGSSYQEKVAFLDQKIYRSHIIRQALNKFNNTMYDMTFAALRIKPVSNLIYNTNLDVLTAFSILLKPIVMGGKNKFSF